MKETMPNVAFPDASHEQIRTLVTRIDTLVNPQKTIHIMLKDLLDDAKSHLNPHEQALNRPVGSEFTGNSKQSDDKRDQATKILLNKVYTAAEEFNEEVAFAGKTVKKVCEDHGGKGIISMKLAEQTDVTRRLLAVLKSPDMMPKIEYLGLAKDLLLVEQFNNEFELFWNKRITEKPETAAIPLMRDVRRELNMNLALFTKNLKWLHKRGKTGLTDASLQGINKLLVELGADLHAQETAKATALAKAN